MQVFSLLLILATFLCALVTGITLIFATVIMPGLKTLGPRGYLEAFKAVDRVIQGGQPVFMAVWLGSALTLIAAALLGFFHLKGIPQYLLLAALTMYIGGVQIATTVVNVPLNNQLQAQNLDELDEKSIAELRQAFDSRWLRWNTLRTWFGALTTIILLYLLKS